MYARDHALIATPIGPIEIDGDEQSISHTQLAARGSIRPGRTATVAEQIDAYFSNNINFFYIISVREELIALRYGETAAGQRCVLNPFPIAVPCHRFLAADGALNSDMAGKDSATEQWLLDHERRYL